MYFTYTYNTVFLNIRLFVVVVAAVDLRNKDLLHDEVSWKQTIFHMVKFVLIMRNQNITCKLCEPEHI